MTKFSKYVGLDTHKDTIAVAIAEAGQSKPRYYGEIANTPEAVAKLVKKLSPQGEVLSFCYEAGPCGYGIYRQLTHLDPGGGSQAREETEPPGGGPVVLL
nr:hypothetical protein [Acidiferrobacter sp. SPIII_3]